MNLTQKWGYVLICLRPYKYLRNEEKQNTCETRKDICILSQGSKNISNRKEKKTEGGATNEPAQVTALDPWHDHLSTS